MAAASRACKSWARVGGRLTRLDFAAANKQANEFNTTISTTDSPIVKRRKLSSVNGQVLLAPRRLTIIDLPEVCIVSILSFLEAHEICLVATVCRRLHEVSLNPVLWWNADFHFLALHDVYDEWHISPADKRKLFCDFLCQRNAKVTSLRIFVDIDREIKLLLRLLEECNVKKLRRIDIRWTCTWECCIEERCVTKVKNFQGFLQLLGECCPSLTALKTQMDISLESAVALSKIQTIHWLELRFQPPRASPYLSNQLSTKAVEKILSLPDLKVLKLRVRQLPAMYNLKSNSLEVFEISWSKNFIISGLKFPRLHTFKAFNVFASTEGLEDYCLFHIIDRGCPLIQWFNERKASAPGFHNFHFAEDELRSMFLCFCSMHSPWRINV